METKTLSLAGLAVAALAVILAVVALATRPEDPADPRQELAALKTELADLNDGLAKTSSVAEETSMRLARLTSRSAALEREVSSLAERPAAEAVEAAEAAEIDDEKLREFVREEMERGVREMMERFRRDFGGRRGRGVTAESLREGLGLEEDKAGRIVEMRNKMGEGIRDIWRENRGGDREKNVELMNELRRKTEGEIGMLLTPEQAEKYRQMQDRGRGRRGRGRRQRGEDRGERPEEPRGERPTF